MEFIQDHTPADIDYEGGSHVTEAIEFSQSSYLLLALLSIWMYPCKL